MRRSRMLRRTAFIGKLRWTGGSVDYIVSGDSGEKAQAMLKDTKLLSLFKAVEDMNEDDKHIITELISTFIFQRDTQKRLTQK